MAEWLTAEEVGCRLHLRPSTIKRWAASGTIPCIRIGTKVRRFDIDQVLAALRRRASQSQSTSPESAALNQIAQDLQRADKESVDKLVGVA